MGKISQGLISYFSLLFHVSCTVDIIPVHTPTEQCMVCKGRPKWLYGGPMAHNVSSFHEY